MQRRRLMQWGAALALSPWLVRSAQASAAHAMQADAAADMPQAAALGLPRGGELPELVSLPLELKDGALNGCLAAAPLNLPLLPGGKATTFWAYNDSVPGPAIALREGDNLRIRFDNHLPQPTTVHWHGLPIPADQDGNPHDAVAPGASREYRFDLPKGSAGTYWYHPHPHGHTAEQVYRGLAGVFVVRSLDDPLAHLPERWLVLSDLKLDAQGQIAGNSDADKMDGREGQFVLVNGAWQPKLTLGVGERQRWRIWNATSARVLKLALPAHEVWLVGTDGGLIEKPRRIDYLLLPPGARAELAVTGRFAAGKPAGLLALPYARGKMMGPEQDASLPILDIAPSAALKTAALPARLRKIAPLGKPAARRLVVFSEDMANPAAMFLINGKTFDMDRMDFIGRVGAVEEWEIDNRADMDHPFHLHGTQFQVTARHDGKGWKQEPYLAWRDVVNVPPEQKVRLRFRQDLPGPRMFHCHILEHEDAGMMGTLDVRA
ncbi:multicopper oxidase family protein [Chromobacterium sp. IIBBL 290-4]|uniref:multicopper oxidase family protein n=1 Tax=Chromobacterium sp. IIBBL 290-4 TaxID=2953890 RepID=UPI0020B8F934|nr:multicopper oxidase family protein [Chromobacterium sp. IIBBL 290-4]UTH72452.1 multicopper oxidase family protein [Chromobacterium sp. IIBBL 290-4]